MFYQVFFFLFLLIIISCAADTGSSVKIIAHRGASSAEPENTLASFSRAVEYGADYFELDVRISSDDSLTVIHDSSVDRTTNGSGQVNLMTFAQLRKLDAGSWFGPGSANEKIPALREALALAKDKIKVCIEIKADNIVNKVVKLIEEMDMEDRVIIFSFDFNHIAQSKKLNPAVPVLYLKSPMTTADIDLAAGIGAEAAGAGSGVTQSLIDYAHNKGIEIWKWTVNSTSEMNSLIKMHIDGIITDYPQTLKSLIND